jgi:hypothetical protein
METIGLHALGRRWAIAEDYIPSHRARFPITLMSGETASILNAGDQDAHRHHDLLAAYAVFRRHFLQKRQQNPICIAT